DAVREAPDHLAQCHPPEAGHALGFRSPAPHAQHLKRRSLALTPGDESPDDVADSERDDSERNGEEVGADAAAGTGEFNAIRQDESGPLVEVRPRRQGLPGKLTVTVPVFRSG